MKHRHQRNTLGLMSTHFVFGVLSRVARTDPVEDQFTRVTASDAPQECVEIWRTFFVKQRPARDCPR